MGWRRPTGQRYETIRALHEHFDKHPGESFTVAELVGFARASHLSVAGVLRDPSCGFARKEAQRGRTPARWIKVSEPGQKYTI